MADEESMGVTEPIPDTGVVAVEDNCAGVDLWDSVETGDTTGGEDTDVEKETATEEEWAEVDGETATADLIGDTGEDAGGG